MHLYYFFFRRNESSCQRQSKVLQAPYDALPRVAELTKHGCNCRRFSEGGRRHTCSQKPSDTSIAVPSHLSGFVERTSAELKKRPCTLVQRQTKSKSFVGGGAKYLLSATCASFDSHGLVTVIDFILFCFDFFAIQYFDHVVSYI